MMMDCVYICQFRSANRIFKVQTMGTHSQSSASQTVHRCVRLYIGEDPVKWNIKTCAIRCHRHHPSSTIVRMHFPYRVTFLTSLTQRTPWIKDTAIIRHNNNTYWGQTLSHKWVTRMAVLTIICDMQCNPPPSPPPHRESHSTEEL